MYKFRYLQNKSITIGDVICTLDEFKQIESEFNVTDFGDIGEIRYLQDGRKLQITDANQLGYENSKIDEWVEKETYYQKELDKLRAPKPPTLEEAKEAKIAELNTYYSSDECWMFKVVKGNDSLTKTQDWFAKKIPAILGFTIDLFNDKSELKSYDLSQEKGLKLNNLIQVQMGTNIFVARQECIAKIQACGNVAEVENIDVKAELGDVPRVMNLDDIN